MAAEAGTSDRGRLGERVFEGMDFDYILRLERQIVSAYTNAGQGAVNRGGYTPSAYTVYIPEATP